MTLGFFTTDSLQKKCQRDLIFMDFTQVWTKHVAHLNSFARILSKMFARHPSKNQSYVGSDLIFVGPLRR